MAKTRLGPSINGVLVTFGPRSDQDVETHLLDVLRLLIRPDVAPGYRLTMIHVSSTSEAYEKHPAGSPHRNGLAVDISKINGIPLISGYKDDAGVKAIADAIQSEAVRDHRVCENFGPLLYQKEAGFVHRTDHKDHIHIRVHSPAEVMKEAARGAKTAAAKRMLAPRRAPAGCALKG
jgi:hypothetical protein